MSKSSKLTVWKFFFSYLIRRKHIYFIGLISVITTAISQTLHPRLVGYAIDQLNLEPVPRIFKFSTPLYSFYVIFGTYFFFHLTLALGRWGWRRFLARETHYAGNYLRKMVWDRVQYFKQSELDSIFTPGVLMSLSSSDVFSARFLYGFVLVATFDISFLLCFSFFGMVQLDAELALWTVSSMPLLGFLSWKISQLETVAYKDSKKELASFNDKVSQVITTIKLQRLSQSRTFWERFLYDLADKFRSKKLRAIIISFYFFPLMGAGVLFSYILLFYFGISKVESGAITVGEFVGLQGFILLLQHPILDLGYIISEWQVAKASLQRLIDLYNNPLDQSLLPNNKKELNYGRDPFSVKNLSFSFPAEVEGTRQEIFSNFNLEVKRNDRLGIKGEIGSGKSTLLKMLAGLQVDFSGEILFRGKDIKSLDREQIANEIVCVDQENFLFADTIRTNITLDQNISDDEIWYYLKLACVAIDIENLEHGLDTELGEWGVNLSGGQKQRLCLARALVRKPSVLLLDDCLSAIDTHTEEVILNNLDQRLGECTVIWVAHRDSTLKKCNRIIELKGSGNELS